jgi:hypothetical protein
MSSSSFVQRATSFDPTAKPRKTVQRRTSFATISVREYEQTIGDSPSCLEGAPVTLGWSFRENRDIPLEEYENARQPFRRRQNDLVLGVNERRNKLVQSGVSLSDVLKAESFSSLKKSASSTSRFCSRKEISKKDIDKGIKKKTFAQSAKELEHKGKPSAQRRSSPPLQKLLQKQMASRAA